MGYGSVPLSIEINDRGICSLALLSVCFSGASTLFRYPFIIPTNYDTYYILSFGSGMVSINLLEYFSDAHSIHHSYLLRYFTHCCL